MIGKEQLDEIKSIFPMQKFFVLGYARSGTTLLARLLRLHPDVYCDWQGHFFSQETPFVDLFNTSSMKAWMDRSSNRWTSGERLLPATQRVVIDFILERKASALGKTIVGDKSPTLFDEQAAFKLSRIYPDAILIMSLSRCPQEWCVSILKVGRWSSQRRVNS